jgi:intracellular septation protein
MYKNITISWSIEFGPIIVFFIALHFLGNTDKGFITSTAIFSALTAVALVVSYLYERRIAWFPLIAGVSVVVFGIKTTIYKEPLFFIVKDTLYNGIFGIFLLMGAYMGKGLLKNLFIALFDMSDKGWFILSVRWGVFFVILAVLNEVSWRFYGVHAWVMYKFWSTIATAVFGFYQVTLSKKYRNVGSSPWGMRTKPYHAKSILE